MGEWKEYRLEEIAQLEKDSWKVGDEELPYIALEHIVEGGLRIQGIGDSNTIASNKYRFNPDCFLFGKLRPYFRKLYRPNFEGICSTDIWVVKPKGENDKDFLFYFFANKEFVDFSYSGSSGTRMPRADWKFVGKSIWSFPPTPEQRAIAEVLSSLDDKIDLLHRQNKTLEQMAETLFRQWFVEEAKEDWEEVKLGSVIETTSGGTPSRSNMGFYEDGIINWVKSKELNSSFILETEEKITQEALKKSSAKILPENSILIAMYGATVGEYAIISKEMTCNQAICALKTNENYPYTYLFLLIKYNKEELINMAIGSAQQNISQLLIKQLPVLNCIDKIKEFHRIVNPYFEKILTVTDLGEGHFDINNHMIIIGKLDRNIITAMINCMEVLMLNSSPRANCTICVPFDKAGSVYQAECPQGYRRQLDDIIKKHPELFPPDIKNGYRMKDCYVSKKLNIKIRRIQIAGRSYTVRPSFVMPYMTAFTDDAEKALFLSKFDIPAWGIARTFGKNGPYWYRMASSLGRFSLVGTTVRDPTKLPLHIAADEKHTKIRGEKCYIPTTVGSGCILGAAVSKNAGNVALLRGYDVFRREALDVDPAYSPETVNIDGWAATRNAFRHLFPTICILCCFLHIYIKMRDGSKKKHRDVFLSAASALWECFQAPTRRSFSQKVRRLAEAGERDSYPESILKPIKKLRNNISEYSESYNHHGCHRTSNMIDRLMQGMNRHLYNTRYFHGSRDTAERNIRGWALIKNFAPQNPAAVKKHAGLQSPAEQLNGKRYHDCWLQNLLISASLGGFRGAPLNP